MWVLHIAPIRAEARPRERSAAKSKDLRFVRRANITFRSRP